MKKLGIALALSATLFLAACGEQDAKRAVEAYGFDSVTIGGTPWYGCGESDSFFYNQRFTALNNKGKAVSGVVCGSVFKGYTVRVF